MHQRLENAGQPRPESAFPAVVGAFRIHRPVNQERPPHDGIPIDESPVAAVQAAVAIVAIAKYLSAGTMISSPCMYLRISCAHSGCIAEVINCLLGGGKL